MRAAASVLVTVGLVAALAGCAAPGDDTGATIEGCEVNPSGALSDSIQVGGAFGAEPEVTFDFPTAAESTQRSIVIEGDGETAIAGDTITAEFALYNGATGEQVSTTGYAGTPTSFVIDEAQFLVGLVKTLECSTVGSRVVGVIPPAESWGDAGSPELGVEPGQDVVFVVDIVGIEPPPVAPLDRAEGTANAPVEGMPVVELDADGRPTVTLPDAPAPTEFEIAMLIQGEGAVVGMGDDVVVHYLGMSWDTGEIFDESWGRGSPATFNTQGVIEGFTEALVGQEVGSQVLVVIPPELAYGTDPAKHELGGQTLVFVIDILGIA